MPILKADPATSEAFTGKVASVRAINRRCADIDLQGVPKAFRLILDKAWVVKKGDRISLAATPDSDGVMTSYVYRNDSKGVTGEKELLTHPFTWGALTLGPLMLLVSVFFLYAVIVSEGSGGMLRLIALLMLPTGAVATYLGFKLREQGQRFKALVQAQRDALDQAPPAN